MTWASDRGLSSPIGLALTGPHGGHRGLKEETVVPRTFGSTGVEPADHFFCCILLSKGNPKGSLGSRVLE